MIFQHHSSSPTPGNQPRTTLYAVTGLFPGTTTGCGSQRAFQGAETMPSSQLHADSLTSYPPPRKWSEWRPHECWDHFWKEMNHLPTINLQGIFVSFHGSTFQISPDKKDLTGLSEEVNTLEKTWALFLDTKRVTSYQGHYLVEIFRRPLGWKPPSKISHWTGRRPFWDSSYERICYWISLGKIDHISTYLINVQLCGRNWWKNMFS